MPWKDLTLNFVNSPQTKGLRYSLGRLLSLSHLLENPHRNVVLKEHKAVFVVIPKVACTSIKAALAEHAGVEIKDNRVHAAKYPELVLAELMDVAYADFFKFAFVRNPVDRLISCYFSLIQPEHVTDRWTKKGVAKRFLHYRWPRGSGENGGKMFWGGMSFTNFVHSVCVIPDPEADKHFRSQHTFIMDRGGKIFVDFIGKFENLEDDFQKVCARTGLPKEKLPHKMKSNRYLHVDQVDERLRARIRRRYDKDFALFGYSATQSE